MGTNNYIYNSYNMGNIEAKDSFVSYTNANGIGDIGEDGKIVNCYNIGNLKGRGWKKNYMIGARDSGNDNNCYYLQGIETGTNCEVDTNSTSFTLQSCNEVVENLNKYIDENSTNEEMKINLWKKWKIGENGYPIFQ